MNSMKIIISTAFLFSSIAIIYNLAVILIVNKLRSRPEPTKDNYKGIVIAIVFLAWAFYGKYISDASYNSRYAARVQISYLNGTNDTINLLVDKSVENIFLENGNLSYLRAQEGSQRDDSKIVSVASYVKKYIVIESEKLTY